MEVNWRQILSVSPEKIDDEDKKDEIFEEIIRISDYDRFDGKNYRKLFKLCQHLLRYKGEQVTSLLAELDALATKEAEMEILGTPEYKSLEAENTKLRKQVERLEFSNSQSKGKIKELSEEIVGLQKKYQDSHFGSEREDSPDALSDLDRQQELLSNISAKNKHIKRLLRDIESLEKESRGLKEQVQELRRGLEDATASLASVTDKYAEAKFKIKEQNDLIEALGVKAKDLESVNGEMQKEMEERDNEIDSFGRKLEERAYAWKNLIDEKDAELEKLKEKYEELLEKHPGYNIDAERRETRRLTDELKTKEERITALEAQLEEFHQTDTKDSDRSAKSEARTAKCCEETQALLDKTKEKVSELEFAMISLEEDNVLKAKQSLEAIDALRQYESGTDGLPQALLKIASLERKIKSRDKQICTLVEELNTLHNLASENVVLRKKLGIAEDEFISTTSIHAKQRKLEKLVERLQLKLRASEEMRLQLKLEKNDLKRRSGTNFVTGTENICEKCLKTFTPESNICSSCVRRGSKTKDEKLEENYKTVVEENENLRIGMHEILHKLRDYDASSDHITVDSSTLEKLLHALDARSVSGWYHPAMRMQNELIVVKERELALKERVRVTQTQTVETNIPSGVEKYTQTDITEEISTNFDTLLSHIGEKTQEIEEFRDKCSSIAAELQHKILENDSMKQQGEELKQLKEILSLSEDDRDQNLLKKSENYSTLQTELQTNRRKLEFLMVDFENTSEELKTERKDKIFLVAELEKELTNRRTRIRFLEQEIHELREDISTQVSESEYKKLEGKFQKLSNLSARMCKDFLENIPESASDNLPTRDFAIVDSNVSVDLVTREEFLDMKYDARKTKDEISRLKIERKHLEEVLKVAQQQISSQQDLLTRYSDEEITLRHLVVDLQCSGSEKQLIARGAREIENLRESEQKLKKQVENLNAKLKETEQKIHEAEEEKKSLQEVFTKNRKNDLLKIQYLTQSLQLLKTSYCKFTPLFLIEEFIGVLRSVLILRKGLQEDQRVKEEVFMKENTEKCLQMVKEVLENEAIEDKIALVRCQTHSQELQKQLRESEKKQEELQGEITEMKISSAESAQHWNTLDLLLKTNGSKKKTINRADKAVQSSPEMTTKSINTDAEVPEKIILESPAIPKLLDSNKASEAELKALESQLKQAMILASTRSALLLETESRLAETQGRIKAFEKAVEEKERLLKEEREKNLENGQKSGRKDDNILSITIASLQNLLLEKDTTLSRYQELLKTERNEHSKSSSEYQRDMESLKAEINHLARRLKEKEATIEDLEQKMKAKAESPEVSQEPEKLFLDDRYLDEMLLDEKRVLAVADEAQKDRIVALETRIAENEEEIRRLQLQLREVSNRESMWEKSLTEKDREISALNERFNTDLRDLSDNIANRREIEQLREMLEEKDRHINDLTDTLTHFHDDQQKFMSDATLHSADQLAQLSAELSRAEASNKVLNTQIEALKRQITNLSQREKQAREMVKTLKNQLIRRPVISIKNERITTREENLQRRIEQLQSELVDTKEELRKQTNLADSRKAKSASDLNLWEKQKRWQGVAEKLKLKLAEKESEIEKLKISFNTAKSQISRLEMRLKGGSRFCHSPSCPHSLAGKYTPAESPESDDDYEEGHVKGVTGLSTIPRKVEALEAGQEIIDALKARIESQQRRIVAMELEGKGSSAVASEVEKLQERVSGLEAQNLRLEARNLQLQLDKDMLKQGDDGERQKRRIKHMEDYILVLKNELSQVSAKNLSASSQPLSDSHQTILALKRIVERLKVENKSLKDTRMAGKEVISKETFEKLKSEHEKMQNLHAEALARVSSLEVELDLYTTARIEVPGRASAADDTSDDAGIREKLRQKTELLEKAKLLLTRAAAKEKNLREQIIFWKRKCSELQNVPFIEETSE
ncbi:centrosomal protein cep290 [Phlebotomus argentipes]|uniref:centrosomal protein cep290 n=1 Tax=Phlebotomus argentipes TaxID=94469 RepID=UPI0028933B24|nr:centrosomal protein cep290 [Phlebotomus argentipes]